MFSRSDAIFTWSLWTLFQSHSLWNCFWHLWPQQVHSAQFLFFESMTQDLPLVKQWLQVFSMVIPLSRIEQYWRSLFHLQILLETGIMRKWERWKTEHSPGGYHSFMTFEDESLEGGEVMLQTKPHQSHMTMQKEEKDWLDYKKRRKEIYTNICK